MRAVTVGRLFYQKTLRFINVHSVKNLATNTNGEKEKHIATIVEVIRQLFVLNVKHQWILYSMTEMNLVVTEKGKISSVRRRINKAREDRERLRFDLRILQRGLPFGAARMSWSAEKVLFSALSRNGAEGCGREHRLRAMRHGEAQERSE